MIPEQGGGRFGLPALALPRLGLALLIVTTAAWLTGAPYLLVRLGVPWPGPLSRLDGTHIFIGVALATVLLLKIAELHVGSSLTRLSGILLWQRWLSLGLLVTYGGVLASGLLLLLPWPSPMVRALVNLHLLTAAWAALMTVVHAGRYLRCRLPPATADLRFKCGVALMIGPAAVLLALPHSVSPLARLGSGGAWEAAGPAHFFASRVVVMPDGELAAAGSGLATSADEGRTWSAVPQLSEYLVRGVATPASGTPVYVATDQGLLVADNLAGPYRPTPLMGTIESVFVEPSDPAWLWAGGAGLWVSRDGGATWKAAQGGLIPKGYIWTIGRFDGVLYAGGTTGIYAWSGSEWQMVSPLQSVYSLDEGANGEIWASSMGGGVEVFRNGSWLPSSTGLSSHGHGSRAIHVDGVTWLGSDHAVAATMDGGVAVSGDGGASWSPLSPGWRPGDVWQVIATPRGLLAATDTGLYLYRLPSQLPADPAWWIFVLAGGAACAIAGAALGLSAVPQVKLPAGRRALLRWLGSL